MFSIYRQFHGQQPSYFRNLPERRSAFRAHEDHYGSGETDRTAVTRVERLSEAAPRPSRADGLQSGTRVIPSAAGTTVHALKSAMQELVGVDVLNAAFASLPSEVREGFEPVTPMTWIPVEVIHTVVARVAELAGRKFDDFMDEAVERAGERTLRTAWRMLLRVTADRALMNRAPILYSKWRNIGRLDTKIIGPGRFEISLTEWPGMSERSIRSLAVTIQTVLRLAGRKTSKIQSQSTPDGAKYLVVWQTRDSSPR
jgi:hypothetical protein